LTKLNKVGFEEGNHQSSSFYHSFSF